MAEIKVRKMSGIERTNEVLTGEHMSLLYGARLNSVTVFFVYTYLIQFLFPLVQFLFPELM
jgi:hypothetical protein